jgi:MADS-box transcription factor, plant
VTVAQSAATGMSMEQLNPFAALDTKCFFPAAPFEGLDMKCFLPGTLQLLEAQHQMLATELNLGYQQLAAPPGTDVSNISSDMHVL